MTPHCIFMFVLLLVQNAAAQEVPSLYVFGDSFVDTGNNNYFDTTSKCNHPPYGINFNPDKTPTGRWSDGMLIPDYIASYLNLSYPQNFWGTTDNFTSGANFASASSGILNTTGIGSIRTFAQQIDDFEIVKYRSEVLYGRDISNFRISRSIFYINIGSNDVANYWRSTGQIIPRQVREYLLERLARLIIRLYDWGARKVVVVSTSVIGCPPLEKQGGSCTASGETSAINYNLALTNVLSDLPRYYSGLCIVYADLHSLLTEVIDNPGLHGFNVVDQPCCPRTESSRPTWCSSTDEYCTDPSTYLFWDIAHPTSAFNKFAAQRFWNGSLSDAFPINIRQLAELS